jgi:DNA-binding transcriptional LysR family regulator
VNSPVPGDELGALQAFAVVADERSFTKAAVRLGVSRSAVSHSVQALEERLGLRLLARTTRTVAPTEAGERLLAQLRPALQGIAAALTVVRRLRASPAGIVRLIAPPMVLATVLGPKLEKFARDFPDVVLDITSEDDTRASPDRARVPAQVAVAALRWRWAIERDPQVPGLAPVRQEYGHARVPLPLHRRARRAGG